MSADKFNVLIVDDKEENLLTLESILESPELNVVKASSGNEALGLMLEYDFALVLLDVQMPGMDGFETAELMRSNKRTKNIPIIFVTAISTERKHVFKGYETGAVDYLYKPLDLEILQSKINAFIEFFKHKQELQTATTKLERTVVELHEAKEIAENATKAKSSFLASMSHEIRTPLNGIIGMAEVMLMDELSELQKERVKDIKMAGNSLLEIINEILDISKIEAEKLELDYTNFSLRELISKVVRILSVKTSDNKLNLVADIDPELPDVLIGDPLRFRQVLINLLGNAVKFTSEGEVKIKISQTDRFKNKSKMIVEVIDTGAGIAPDKIAKLFQSYEQASPSTTREYGGTGLGLTISKKIVDLMKSDLMCESELGKGSRFYFEIVFDVAEEQSNPWKLKRTLREQLRHIIIADKNKSTRDMLYKYFRYYGIEAHPVASIGALRELINPSIASSIVLLDSNLAEEDSCEDVLDVYKKINEAGAKSILLRAYKAAFNKSKQSENHGIEFSIEKPLVMGELIKVLDKLVNAKVTSEKKNEVEKPVVAKSEVIKILLAEDQLINRKIVIGLLKKYNCEIEVAENGAIAVDKYKQKDYDVVLMDVQMSQMDGYEATRQIRRLEKDTGKHIPIIAMTAHAMNGDREKCLASGMDHYITKPIDVKEVVRSINSYLQKKCNSF